MHPRARHGLLLRYGVSSLAIAEPLLIALAALTGIAGAGCTTDDNCDNGMCNTVTGTCQGGLGAVCGADDGLCTGYLYCTNADSLATVSQTCGGLGAFCTVSRYLAADASDKKLTLD